MGALNAGAAVVWRAGQALGRALRATKAGSAHPRDPVVAEWWGGGWETSAGFAVTPDAAMRIAAVYACVRYLANTVGTLPVHLYRRRGDRAKDRAVDHPLWPLVTRRPNVWQTRDQFLKYAMVCLLLRGNFYALKVEGADGALRQLVPLPPDRVRTVQLDNLELAYEYAPAAGPRRVLLAREVMHVTGLTLDGVTGLSPIAYERETLGLALAQTDYAARFFANDNRSGLTLKAPPGFFFKDAESRQNFTKAIADARAAGNRHRALVLEYGFEPVDVRMTNDEAQFIEARKMTRSEIAGLFGVPPHKIGDLDRSTNNNIEHQAIEVVTDAVAPWCVALEMAFLRDVIGEDRADELFVKFNVNALLRGDTKTRADYYLKMRQMRAMSANDVRDLEDMNEIEGGDVYDNPNIDTAAPGAEPGTPSDSPLDPDEAPGGMNGLRLPSVH